MKRLLLIGLLALVPACAVEASDTSGADDVAESALTAPAASKTTIVGAIAYGETKRDIPSSTSSTYLALTFVGKKGDAVVVDVTATGEDANAWLLDDTRRVVAKDVTPIGVKDAHAAHLTATLAKDATYTIVFREAHGEKTTYAVSLAGPPPPPPPCTWSRAFEQTYGQAWSPNDVAFVTSDGAVHRGMATLDLQASKNQVPDIVKTLGSSANVREIRLYGANGAANVLASRNGANVYGLGDAMWHQVNGYAAQDFVETTLLRLFTEPVHSYDELKAYFRKLTASSVDLVPAEDKADYAVAVQQLMSKVDSGAYVFKLGTGHAIDFWQTGQTVNGKTFAFQFSDAYGLDPKIGMQKTGGWTFWPTIGIDPICR